MTPEENIAAVRREGAALAEAARGQLDVNVPSCPEWSMSDLVWHVGGIHRHRIWLITEKPPGPRGFEIDRPSDDEIVDWFAEGVDALAKVLESHDPTEPCWTWFKPDQSVGFWQRRMAQETAVHRWDGEDAAGRAQPIEPVLAADGIDEFFDTLLPVQDKPPTGNGETILVHSTDAPSEWFLTVTPDGTDAVHGHQKADAAIRGGASDVLLALWRRLPLDRVEISGDNAVAERFVSAMDLS
jgi:uncharacterized protein (TIGR03083 family)